MALKSQVQLPPDSTERSNFNFRFDFGAIKNTIEHHLFIKTKVAFLSTKLVLQFSFKY